MENIEGGQLNEKEQRKELTCEADETANETFPRRSGRPSVPTEKMLLYQRDEQNKREKKLLTIYEHWKGQVRVYREDLKSDLSDSRLAEMADDIERTVNDMTKAYSEYRERNEPSHVIRRKMDSCESVTKDIMKIISERLAAIDEYDADRERQRLHQLLAYEHAKSIFGTASQSSYQSEASIAAKRIDAVAELAAKEAQYKITQEEIKQKQKIREMEEKHRRELDAQRSELERLQAEKERQAARAKLEIYDKELRVDMDSQLMLQSNGMSVINQSFAQPASELSTGSYHPHVEQYASIPVNNPLQQLHSQIVTPSPPTDVLQLAKAIQDSIAVSRIPVPVPIVFSGDPITYIEWKASFISLVGHKGISPAEKLHLLKRYITGPALKCLEGTFYRSDEEAYKDAWKRLDQRYGQPFVVQKAFRDKLSKWPKIHSKDAEGLRAFSDFLTTCLQATPHVKGLEILSDCEENQKLLQKIPEWLATRWNRQVTVTLMKGKDFPSFKDFAEFVALEAEIACNPVTSSYALYSSSSSLEKRYVRETKPNRSVTQVFTTQATVQGEKTKSNDTRLKVACMFCKDESHQLSKCPSFSEKSLDHKRTFVKENKLCYGCLKVGHNARDCRHRHKCDTCKGRHPTCLHNESHMANERPQSSTNVASTTENDTMAATALNVTKVGQSGSTSMIVPVWVSTTQSPSKEQLVYALLDTQSDNTFVSEEVTNQLQAASHPVKLKLTTMLGVHMTVKSQRVAGLRVRGYNSDVHIDLPPSYTKDYIPFNYDNIPTNETARQWPHLSEIADQIPPLLSCDVGLLIGFNCPRTLAPKQVLLGKDNEPFAIQTDLGWSIVGGSSESNETETSLCHRVMVKEMPAVTPMDMINVLESDFKDTKACDKTVSQEDLVFLEKLKEGIKKNEQGYCEMPLPFKQRPNLPDNRRLAEIRLEHLRRRLNKDENYKNDYVAYMNDIIERGDVEEVHNEGTQGEQWYIPHHGIYHPKKPTKLRVVFDCSAKHNGTSLNDHLLQGPDLINNLTGILLRFRQHPIALMCDIEKMFHQFHVSERDRDYLRFLWWKNGDTSTQPQTYRMKVHLFGASSSPGCANYGLKYLAKEHCHSHPAGSQFIEKDFYVDDGVTSTNTVKEAMQLAQEAREVCRKGNLRLHKFVSNNHTVLQSIPASECAVNINIRDLTFKDMPQERALGIQWSIEKDCFKFDNTLKVQPATRRGILSTVASIYDPLGFLAPYVLNGKKILQEMCQHGVGWDDPIPNALKPRWVSWQSDFVNLDKLNIPRCYLPANFGETKEIELHHFSDASSSGYGQCSYLRAKNAKGEVHCSLVIAKARVSPTKLTTIPRLELTAAVVSVSVSNMLREELCYGAKEYFWTDSKVVLGYINNDARRFHTFVANRVQRIRESTSPQQWFYVPSELNPADGASRGVTVNELNKSIWFTGPSFLWKNELPTAQPVELDLTIGDPEVRKVQTMLTKVTDTVSLAECLSKFSSWSKAIKAVARLIRRARHIKSNASATVSEQKNAELVIIRRVQSQAYEQEIKQLKKGEQLPHHNKLFKLDIFMDTDGLLKVGGRLQHATSDTFKHPIVIPKEHCTAKLIISHCHDKVKHQGKGFTINEIRSSGYWIPGMSKTVASFIRQCVICRRLRKAPEGQRMSDLPPHRLEPSPPFTHCGMDCFGPFVTTEGRKQHKRYGLLFTCFCSRAIHIEFLEDLSTDAFINALRCFISIRGAVRHIQCDQGTNFVGAQNEFKAALNELDTQRLTTYLTEKQCDFVMNAPHASHAGGVWERQIKTVRSVLNTTLSLAHDRLNDASLRTLFYEAMAIVNSRPLTIDNLNSPNSLEPLTPNHLLHMKSNAPLPPPGAFSNEDLYSKKRWRRVQFLAEQFWSRWRREYIHNIISRQKWHSPKRNLKVGDVVLEMDELAPRGEWRLARVVETVSGKDGLVRRVKISLGEKRLNNKGQRSTKLSVVERPVQKLVLLLESS
ncbi:uncharacterized protein LOC113014739 [Astatotilapia calliptera]|uniref:uncharacterized protein LOC113014739 n=1 Tax=Astatotilapia calliptera TaxID=8154 RepID=UPI000E3FF746|nr:uncharacterized protein LOC113014739 [Astatotilapia calliptera]